MMKSTRVTSAYSHSWGATAPHAFHNFPICGIALVPISMRIKGDNESHSMTFMMEADNPFMSSVGRERGIQAGPAGP